VSHPQDQLSTSLSQLSGLLLAEQTVEELLQTVVGLATSTVPRADGVSVSFAQDRRLTTTHATDDVVRELDEVQYRDGKGPCVDAIRTGTSVHFDVASDRDLYPVFADAADSRFITAVLSTPLTAGERVLGGLNCYSASQTAFNEDDADVLAQFARQASVVIANAAALADAITTKAQLHLALESRDLIGQAKGMLMERRGCSADEAFDVLRHLSQRENKKLTLVAREIVEGRRRDDG
jgi:GAF domain-containing protein